MQSKKTKHDDCSDKLISLQTEIDRLTSITEEQQALLSEYQSSLSNFQLLFEKTNEAYCICDPSGNILLINQNAATILGFSAAELINQNLIELNSETEMFISAGKHTLTKLLKSKIPALEQFIIKNHAGMELILEMHVQPHHAREGLLHIITFKDSNRDKISYGKEKKQKQFLELLVKERTSNLLTTYHLIQICLFRRI